MGLASFAKYKSRVVFSKEYDKHLQTCVDNILSYNPFFGFV